MDYLKLSKIISLALRHTPETYNLVLDNHGWGNVCTLLDSIVLHHNEYVGITYQDLLCAINISDKKRHELIGEKIRALYGHTIDTLIERENAIPPVFLYHGTSSTSLKKIKVEGLQKMNRQHVHLSSNIEQARQVALRKTANPVMLKIKALLASNSGIIFYNETNTWLSDLVPAEFIEIGT